MAALTMGLTDVQYRRISGKVTSDIAKHFDEAIGRSFLSATSVASLRSLIAKTLAALR